MRRASDFHWTELTTSHTLEKTTINCHSRIQMYNFLNAFSIDHLEIVGSVCKRENEIERVIEKQHSINTLYGICSITINDSSNNKK